jgi:ORF6N domain-containing protein
MYGVAVRALNQAVKRNLERFPSDFMFQLTATEASILRSQFVISRPWGGRRIPL